MWREIVAAGFWLAVLAIVTWALMIAQFFAGCSFGVL